MMAYSCNPVEPQHLKEVAYCNNLLGNYDAGLEMSLNAINMGAEGKLLADCCNIMVVSYSAKKDYQNALRFCQKAIESEEEATALNFGNRAFVNYNLGEFEKSVEDFTRAININPIKLYYSSRSKSYQRLGSLELAREDEETAATAKEE